MTLFALLLSAALAADCDGPTRTHELANALTSAETAYLDMDEEGFIAIRAQAEHTLECLGEPLTPFDAAAFHRLVAMEAFLAADDGATVAAFRSSLAAQPRYLLPSSLAPPGNPLAELYVEASEPYEAKRVALPPPTDMLLFIDGARGTARPTARPVIVQILGPDGGVMWTGFLAPHDPNPSWFALGLEEEDEVDTAIPLDRTEEPNRRSDRANNIRVARRQPQITPGRTKPLALAAGGAALGAGALYAAAYGLRRVYDDPSTPYEDLETLRGFTNGAVVASGGVGIAALGLGIGAVVTIQW